MKKQVLFLTLFVAAILGGMNAYGQDPTFTPEIADGQPTTYLNTLDPTGELSCAVVNALSDCGGTIDELHPQPGQPYTYGVTTTDRDGDDQIHWFVIANQTNLITSLNNITGLAATGIVDPGDGTGNYILSTEVTVPQAATDVYNNPPQTDDQINITWKSFDGSTAIVLLVAYVVDVDDCTDNIEVYRIKPEFNFTLDIAAVNDLGAIIGAAGTNTASECMSPIESATYAGTLAGEPGEGTLTVDYGENWLFFSVTAANFTHSWLPSFQTTYTGTLTSPSEGITVEWAYAEDALSTDAADWHTTSPVNNTTPGVTTYTSTDDPVLHTGTVLGTSIGADDGTGECIIVRVRIDHGTAEENADVTKTLKLAVDGVMYDAIDGDYAEPTLADLHYADCTADQFTNDWVDYNITPRPNITTNTTVGTGNQPFEIKTGN
jgi:hypothetical protein